jgi:hypothetical protein
MDHGGCETAAFTPNLVSGIVVVVVFVVVVVVVVAATIVIRVELNPSLPWDGHLDCRIIGKWAISSDAHLVDEESAMEWHTGIVWEELDSSTMILLQGFNIRMID